MQTLVHYSLHFLAPGLIAWLFFRDQWKLVWLLFVSTMLVDLDHLLATPVFDPNRCSIGFHPLHSPLAISTYFLVFIVPHRYRYLRVIALGLLFHIFTDLVDCVWMFYYSADCWQQSAIYNWLN